MNLTTGISLKFLGFEQIFKNALTGRKSESSVHMTNGV